MRHCTIILTVGLLAGLLYAPALGQEQPAASPLRVATAVPGRIITQLEETRFQQDRLDARRRQLESQQRERQEALQQLQHERDQLRPGSEQWAERHQELLRGQMEFELWFRTQQMEAQRMQKQLTMELFSRIQEAAGEVARQRGIHIVISEPDIPHLELVDLQDLRTLLNQRNLLYATDSVDISEDVVNLMNERFRAGR